MSAQGPVLVGTRGMVEGESFALEYGKSIIIGRSRSCDLSVRNCRRWIEAEEAGTEPKDGAKTVSRRHLKITFHDANSIELEDLSSNGTFVDGKRIDRLVVTDVKETAHEITLGGGDVFRLEWK